MGLFGKKRDDEIDGASDAVTAPPEPEVLEKPVKKNGFGIEQLVSLMRRLPTDNVELVVRVLKETLESVNITMPGLIKEAEKREGDLKEDIADFRRSISTLEDELAAKKRTIEEEIAKKKKSIEELEASLQEISGVKERLNLGLNVVPAPRESIKQQPPPLPESISHDLAPQTKVSP